MADLGQSAGLERKLPSGLLLFALGVLGVSCSILPVLAALSAGAQAWNTFPRNFVLQREIATVAWESCWISAISAALAVILALSTTTVAYWWNSGRQWFYLLLSVMLFTNPIFLVFVWTFLWPGERNALSVVLLAAYILFPVASMVLLSGLRSLPASILGMARLAGASGCQVAKDIIFPWVIPEIILAWLLGYVSALGFYLVPLFAGGARIQSAAVRVDRALTQVGDSGTAGLFALVIVGVGCLGAAFAWTAYRFMRPQGRGVR